MPEKSLRCILNLHSTHLLVRKTWTWRRPRHMQARTTFLLAFSTVCSPVTKKRVHLLIIPPGSWTTPLEPGKQPGPQILNSNRHEARPSLEYSDDDIKHIEKWSKEHVLTPFACQYLTIGLQFLVTLRPPGTALVHAAWPHGRVTPLRPTEVLWTNASMCTVSRASRFAICRFALTMWAATLSA